MMFSHLSLPVKLCLVMLCRVYRPSVRPYLMPLFELLSPTIPSRPSQRMLHAKNPAAWNTGTKTENKGGVQGGYHVSRGCFSCGVRVRMLIERERERESCYVNRVLRSKNRLFSFPSHVSQGGGGGGGGGGTRRFLSGPFQREAVLTFFLQNPSEKERNKTKEKERHRQRCFQSKTKNRKHNRMRPSHTKPENRISLDDACFSSDTSVQKK